MPHPRTVRCDALFAFFAIVAFLVPGIVTASPNPSTQQQGHMIPAQPSHEETIGFKVLSSTGGIDFNPYLTTLFKSIVRSFHAKIPKSVAAGEREAVVVQVRIQKDGLLADKFVTIVSSSGEKEFDAAALSAIRTAAPFARLPEGYPSPYIDLQISFYYYNPPPAPEQKPKVVPIVTALTT
jgi:periplasmic protein TonB